MGSTQGPEIVIVPVRIVGSGMTTLHVCRRPDGVRTGVAFTSVTALEQMMGASQPSLTASLGALRSMLAEVGVHAIQVNPEVVTVGATWPHRAAS